ncbi:hypothetical protein [Rhodanobacter sp. DHB23]|uniref:hypothetical protein n=1 Tax=Rhodanobacter sp. DHB23 TaxID=2775923 RepID=UPI0017848C6C|nr:hypothetical protein [Rhodanobacter sp. DHB23]MBD8872479.1 hypothetical protein [Rhodanobacter sp. DHB23]
MTAEDLARGAGREGRDAIRTALRELQDAGYIVRRSQRTSSGTFGGQILYVFDTPQASKHREPENPLAGKPPAEKPPAEKPVRKSSKSTTQVTTSTRVRAAAASLHVPAAANISPQKFKKKIVHPNGVESWYDSDVTDAQMLTSDEHDDDIRAAVAAVEARGQSPVASVVRREIKKQRSRPSGETMQKSRGMQAMDALDEVIAQIKQGRTQLATGSKPALPHDPHE